MTSITAPISLYNLCSSAKLQYKEYEKGGVMKYIYDYSPVFAFCVQKLQLDDWFNSPNFNATCFVPIREYSNENLDYIMSHIDYQTARDIVSISLISGRVKRKLLETKELIPTHNKYNSLKISLVDNDVLLNDYIRIVKPDIELTNGIVHLVNGLLPPSYSI
jgi:hypothetical protein